MIITNNCLGGYIYKINNKVYDNPFIWSRLFVNSFNNLIKNFNELNFNNFQLKSTDDLLNTYNNLLPHQFSIIINDIRIIYRHIKYDANANEPIIKKINNFTGDMYSKFPYKIVYDNYVRRLKRFNKNDKCLFVFMNDAPQYDNDIELNQLLRTVGNSTHNLILFTEPGHKLDNKFKNVSIIEIEKK